jgi:histidinol phosphatase-like enzyme
LKRSAAIARVYHCPYHPLHGIGEYRREHPWRKPNPGMILQAMFDFRFDPAWCAIVGDKMSDIEGEGGAAAGLGLQILVASRPCQNVGRRFPPHGVVADLSEALALLWSRFAAAAADRCSWRERFNT